ncbi:MAG TPA: succinyl-diaminopimelate desuccinylase [Acidimicrobiales bacterium]|nr:succinyl-diaminopimelate desuccinylase [Acidimicrobiales bacterium]
MSEPEAGVPTDPGDRLPEDLLALTAALVDQPSESRAERPLVDWIEAELRVLDHLEVTRVGDNLVARSDLGLPQRVILAGHTDTVPANGNARARIEGDTLWGVGSTDMKGGLAIQLALARAVPGTAVDVTYVFYAREEVAAVESGLGELFEQRPDLLAGDVAFIGEPTGGSVEAGCQGTLRGVVTLKGKRAHPARPWMGRNAIHRVAPVLEAITTAPLREPIVDGLEFRESLQALGVEGGVAGNVVPDEVTLTLNHRFAPDRSPAEAEAFVRSVLAGVLEDGDRFEVTDVAAGALPQLSNPLLAAFVGRADLSVDAKLGWTDVARFAAHEIPAVNFGPGDALLAHTAEERLERAPLEWCFRVLRALVTQGL